MPQLAAAVLGGTVASLSTTTWVAGIGAASLGFPLLSPFSAAPGTCCPFAKVSNFNVYVGGKTWYPENVLYGWQLYNNEIRKNPKTPFGNSVRGICSGLIDQVSWETNHGYIYVNLNRWESAAEDNKPKTIGIAFQNAGNFTCDYHVFLIYEREISISAATGQLIKEQ